MESVVQKRVLRYFRRQGLLDELDAAGMLTWQGSGGFSVDASVRIEGEDRAGIERLVRYCARPPFALERLHPLDSSPSSESRLLYRFPKPDIHGRTELLLTPIELLEAVRPSGHPTGLFLYRLPVPLLNHPPFAPPMFPAPDTIPPLAGSLPPREAPGTLPPRASRRLDLLFVIRRSTEEEEGHMKSSPETITLRRETVEGFVDRGGNFRTDGAKTERADRWVSDYFNLRRRADDADVAGESDVKDG